MLRRYLLTIAGCPFAFSDSTGLPGLSSSSPLWPAPASVAEGTLVRPMNRWVERAKPLDGDLDVVVTRLNAEVGIFRNEATAPRIAVRLVGDAPNRAGIGATVRVRSPGLPDQSRALTAGGYYLSGSEALLTFAASDSAPATLVVTWRDGRQTIVPEARANRLYEIREAAARAATPADSAPTALFTDATALLGGQVHVEPPFDDFRRQPLLPNRFSQLGPGVAWVDADGDGDEDLVVGAGRTGMLTLLENQDGHFTERPAPDAAAGDLTAVVPVPDGTGRLRLAVGQSNYEAETPGEALAMPRVLGVPLRRGAPGPAAPLLAGDTASVGALAAGDVDGDGRLDLFVAPRVIGGLWPVPAPSTLLLGQSDGGFVPDRRNAAVLRGLGLISAALLVDVVGDARPDLVVAVEFGPVRVLRNQGGRFDDVTASLGLSAHRSRWNGLAAIDVDADGRLDLVATSWGRNLPWGASPDRPHLLVTGPFGEGGPALVFARADSVTGREMPLESFARLGLALPTLRRRIATYAEFAASDVDAVLGPDAARAVRVGATTYDHTLFRNRGSRFEAEPLPARAQVAPAFGVSVADFDGDGAEDLFLAQNFFPTEIGTMRFDAGAGVVLLGDGRGGFRVRSVPEAGVSIRGDQRGSAVADFDGDGRVDLAVGQNGGTTQLYKNATGTPGLRIALVGGGGNPSAIGALVRVEGENWQGPVRAVLAGQGYWSTDGSPVLPLSPGAQRVWVRWPNGREVRVPIPEAGTRLVLRPE